MRVYLRVEDVASLRGVGVTLIELLIVLVISGILLANVRTAVAAVETYFSDNNGYTGMTVAGFQAIDAGVKLGAMTPVVETASTYCIKATVGDKAAWESGSAASAVTVKPACCS